MLEPNPKPKRGSSRRRKNKRRRDEKKVIIEVRPQVEDRDGYCRLAGVSALGPCDGASQWAHFGSNRRFATRGKPAVERHTKPGSLMLCDKHHDDYDGAIGRSRMKIDALTEELCDGPLRFERAGLVYVEESK